MENSEEMDPAFLIKVANMRMPFGKYKGFYLVDLPEAYLGWFSQKGFPDGELGLMMQTIHEVKINGLEKVVRPLIRG